MKRTKLYYIGAVSRDNEDRCFVDFGIMPQESVSQNFNELFGSALALQQEKKWDESIAAYQQLLDQSRNSLSSQQGAVVYHNMSVVAYSKNDFLKAYIWSKKALNLDPSNEQIRGSFENYATKVEVPSIPHQISPLDHFKSVVSVVPVDFYLITTVVLGLATIWLFFRRAVTIKKNKLAGVFKKPLPWKEVLLAVVTLHFLAMSIISIKESQTQKAIVVSEKAAVQTVPGENKPVIFEAQAGLELEVLAATDDYFQVRYPGAFTGWVNRNQVELLSLSFRQ